MNNDWRLVPGFTAFIIPGVHKVYLASPEKKQYLLAVSKQIETSTYSEIECDINEFELKVEKIEETFGDEKIGIFIKNPEIFPEDAWYRVMNFYNQHFINFIVETKSNKGHFDCLFETIFSESNPGEVSFVSPEMSSYKRCLEEMKRRINCEVNRKSRKWVPGHRYDTLKETYYFIGEFLSRKSDPKNSVFISDASQMVPVYLYTNIIDEEKSISDLLKTRKFGTNPEDIKVLYTLPTAVESGEVIADDVKDISIYWDNLVDNTMESCKSLVGSGGYCRFERVGKVFDILAIQSPTNLLYGDDIKDRMKFFYTELAKDTLLTVWNNTTLIKDYHCSNTNTLKDNQTALKAAIICLKTGDSNISRMAYYPDLFRALEIDTDTITLDILTEWNESNLQKDFDTYLKYSFYFDYRKGDAAVTSRQRVESTSYKLDVVTLQDIFGDNELSRSLRALVTEARDSYGAGISRYTVYNNGTRRKPIEYVNCEITLDDLLKFKKRGSGLSENLKNEIMRLKFTRVIVSIDKTKEVE